jgi:hypothetical protein
MMWEARRDKQEHSECERFGPDKRVIQDVEGGGWDELGDEVRPKEVMIEWGISGVSQISNFRRRAAIRLTHSGLSDGPFPSCDSIIIHLEAVSQRRPRT